jgi:membrane-associated phospholipid phosphatase
MHVLPTTSTAMPTNSGTTSVDERAGSDGLQPTHAERRHCPAPRPSVRVLLTGGTLTGLGVALTTLVATGGDRWILQSVDDWWMATMVDLRWAPLITISMVLSVVFQAAVNWPVRLLITIVIAARRDWVALRSWLLTLAVSELCIGPLKALIDRPRPPGSLIATTGDSYPSGHAIAAAVTAIGMVMALTSGGRRLRWLFAAVSLATVVALSRPYLSAHWLSDVLGGSLIGAGLALGIPETLRKFRVHSVLEPWRKRRSQQMHAPPESQITLHDVGTLVNTRRSDEFTSG